MKVTAQEEYGLRCIVQLARRYGEVPLSGRAIAEQEGLSTDYVTKLLVILRKAGLVRSIRGIKGGFTLTREPQSILVGEVLRSLNMEDGIVLTSPDSHLCDHFSGQLDACIHIGACGIRPVWITLSGYISRMLDQISLFELLQDEVQVMDVMELASQDVTDLKAVPEIKV
jgi:Rrf2 family protein